MTTSVTQQTKKTVAREAAIPLWQKIAASIRQRILAGDYAPGEQLPADRQIAIDYGTSRMTVRQALATLEREGKLRVEHGNGTFVSDDPIAYTVGKRVRFDENLNSAELSSDRTLLDWRLREASAELSNALGLPVHAPILEMTIGAFANSRPIAIGVRYCCAARFGGFVEAFEQERSFSKALRRYGIEDYRRERTEIIARMPSPEEAKFLRQPRTLPVLAYTALDAEVSGTILSYYEGCFAGERVKIVVDLQGVEP
ncbi:phosphonate metabolism transcriptional regulator PhnF [Rhizobium rhizogenes]